MFRVRTIEISCGTEVIDKYLNLFAYYRKQPGAVISCQATIGKLRICGHAQGQVSRVDNMWATPYCHIMK